MHFDDAAVTTQLFINTRTTENYMKTHTACSHAVSDSIASTDGIFYVVLISAWTRVVHKSTFWGPDPTHENSDLTRLNVKQKLLVFDNRTLIKISKSPNLCNGHDPTHENE